MQVLIVDDQIDRQAELAIAFMQSGFQTTSTSSQPVAESCIRRGAIDLLVMAERVGGTLTHSLALLAEYRNPMAVTMLLTNRKDPDLDELYLLLPSLHCILAPDTAPALVTRLAIASVAGAKEIQGPMLLTPALRIGDTDAKMTTFASVRGPTPQFAELLRSA